MRKIIIVLIVVLILGLCFFILYPRLSAPNLELGRVTFENGKAISIELPETDAEYQLGLGGRDGLDDSSGMMFIFQTKDYHSFWMKGMKFPIDILWLDNETIVYIEENVPHTIVPLKTYKPDQLSNLVLEVRAGFVEDNEIEVGDRVQIRY